MASAQAPPAISESEPAPSAPVCAHRHARNVVLDNIGLNAAGDVLRPAIVADGIDGLRIDNLDAYAAPGVEPIRMINVNHARVRN